MSTGLHRKLFLLTFALAGLARADAPPDDPAQLGWTLQDLTERGEVSLATALLEEALARHPESDDFVIAAIDFYGGQKNQARQRELIEAWLDRAPGSTGALHWLLNTEGWAPETIREHIERFLAAGTANADRVDFCVQMMSFDVSAYRGPALRCLTQVSRQAEDTGLRRLAAAYTAAMGGDREELARALPKVPADQRLKVVLTAVRALGEGQCPRKRDLLRLVPWQSTAEDGFARFGTLRDCRTYGPFQAAYLEALSSVQTRDLQPLLWAWFLQPSHEIQDEFGLAPRVVAVLEKRWRRQTDEWAAWNALTQACEMTGREGCRTAYKLPPALEQKEALRDRLRETPP